MSLPKLLFITTFLLFGIIGIAALFKSGKKQDNDKLIVSIDNGPTSIDLSRIAPNPKTPLPPSPQPVVVQETISTPDTSTVPEIDEPISEIDRMQEFFNLTEPRFPIVETITYKSRVPWMKGRPAWLSDYATYYSTSRHFIARSLNGRPDYFKQDLGEGDRFNVLKKDSDISFHLLIDVSRSKMWFYYIDEGTNERMLIKTYNVGLGREDKSRPSGLLTPLGKYSLGSKIAIYKPKSIGTHNNEKIEMIRVFGTRWIPFEQEIAGCTAPAKGYGIHGVPWIINGDNEWEEDAASLGKYLSDGCVRLGTGDMEELFAIIITKPTTIELVKDYRKANLPGVEKP